MEHKEIDYFGVKLLVIGKHNEGFYGSHTDPPEPDEFEIFEIEVNDVNIIDILTHEAVSEIEQLILNKYYR